MRLGGQSTPFIQEDPIAAQGWVAMGVDGGPGTFLGKPRGTTGARGVWLRGGTGYSESSAYVSGQCDSSTELQRWLYSSPEIKLLLPGKCSLYIRTIVYKKSTTTLCTHTLRFTSSLSPMKHHQVLLLVSLLIMENKHSGWKFRE